MLHRCAVLPIRVGHDDPGLSCRVSRIVGYRLVCSCGERGKARATFALARLELREHRDATKDGERVAPFD